MDILEFIVGCFEDVAEWRIVLMIVIGITLATLSLIWVRPQPVAIILAAVGFVGSVICGFYWQRSLR
ncbi:hypothetical protein [Massilia sp. TWP1-3-3]|uniref:hypothetical protein n=1 Tax=Massilia sp. TWP1-3-3 TaxID=2804573 RepID=UPI003CE863AB